MFVLQKAWIQWTMQQAAYWKVWVAEVYISMNLWAPVSTYSCGMQFFVWSIAFMPFLKLDGPWNQGHF